MWARAVFEAGVTDIDVATLPLVLPQVAKAWRNLCRPLQPRDGFGAQSRMLAGDNVTRQLSGEIVNHAPRAWGRCGGRSGLVARLLEWFRNGGTAIIIDGPTGWIGPHPCSDFAAARLLKPEAAN